MRRRVELNEETDSFHKITGDIKKRKRRERKNKRRKFYRQALKVMVVLLFVFLVYQYDAWEGSRLETVVIKGNDLLTKERVQEISKLEAGNRMHLTFNSLIKNKLEKDPLIESAQVDMHRKEQTVFINITETASIAYEIQPEMNIYFENGEKIAIDEDNIHGVEGLVLLSNIEDDKFKKEIVLQLAALESSTSLAISEIVHKSEKLDDEALILVMNHGYYVFSNVETLPLLDNYATIISGANPEYKCIHLLEYGPTEDTQVATATRCEIDTIENDEEE